MSPESLDIVTDAVIDALVEACRCFTVIALSRDNVNAPKAAELAAKLHEKKPAPLYGAWEYESFVRLSGIVKSRLSKDYVVSMVDVFDIEEDGETFNVVAFMTDLNHAPHALSEDGTFLDEAGDPWTPEQSLYTITLAEDIVENAILEGVELGYDA